MKIIELIVVIIITVVVLGLFIAYFAYCASFWFKPFMETPFICVSK